MFNRIINTFTPSTNRHTTINNELTTQNNTLQNITSISSKQVIKKIDPSNYKITKSTKDPLPGKFDLKKLNCFPQDFDTVINSHFNKFLHQIHPSMLPKYINDVIYYCVKANTDPDCSYYQNKTALENVLNGVIDTIKINGGLITTNNEKKSDMIIHKIINKVEEYLIYLPNIRPNKIPDFVNKLVTLVIEGHINDNYPFYYNKSDENGRSMLDFILNEHVKVFKLAGDFKNNNEGSMIGISFQRSS